MKLYLNGIFLILFFACKLTLAFHCDDSRGASQNLPLDIGPSDTLAKLPYTMHCDTMWVPKGQITRIHAGSHLFFAKSIADGWIKVEGVLKIEGSKDNYVFISGAVENIKGNLQPTAKKWNGIEVTPNGELEMKFVGVTNAPNAITAFSNKVKITNSWFKGSSGLYFPDGSLYKMEPKWEAINAIDFAQGNTNVLPIATTPKAANSAPKEDKLSANEKSSLFKNPNPWSMGKKIGAASALGVVGIVGGYWIFHGKSSGSGNTDPDNAKLSPLDPLGDIPFPK